MSKPSKTSFLIARIAQRALAPKSGEYDYPMADAYSAAYRLRGEHKQRALTILRALQGAQEMAKRWADFQLATDGQQKAAYALRMVPRTWLRPSVLACLPA